ncbi:MAG: transcription-repair coupling factor, partial [Caloramator sp.]|nr:transcription-repair coupling factor [Caloramator sp.]
MEVFLKNREFNEIIKAIENKNTPCQVHGLSESQKALICYCLFLKLNRQMLILSYNDIEAKRIYDDIRNFTDQCYYFPSKQLVLNIDVTSFEVKSERLKILKKILNGETMIVVSTIDSVMSLMPPKEILKRSYLEIKEGLMIEVLDLVSKLYELGYERVDVVEGKGQFAQRGGIVDIFPIDQEEPVRI